MFESNEAMTASFTLVENSAQAVGSSADAAWATCIHLNKVQPRQLRVFTGRFGGLDLPVFLANVEICFDLVYDRTFPLVELSASALSACDVDNQPFLMMSRDYAVKPFANLSAYCRAVGVVVLAGYGIASRSANMITLSAKQVTGAAYIAHDEQDVQVRSS